MKFTGHERDLANVAGDGDDLDYMHARHYSPITGRFLSVDTINGLDTLPQSWNRYAYVHGNPMTNTDPWGLWPAPSVKIYPPTGMTVYDVGFGETINVLGSAVKLTYQPFAGNTVVITNPTNSFWDTIDVVARGDGPEIEKLSLIDRWLSEVPLDGLDFGNCVRENRLDWGALTAYTIGNPIANKLAGDTGRMGFGGLAPHPTSWQHKLGAKLSRSFRNPVFSRAGKAVGRYSLPLTVFEGFYDIGAISRCAAVAGGN